MRLFTFLRTPLVALAGSFALVVPLHAEPATEVEGRIVSAGLFKNGLAMLRTEVEVDGTGRYRLADTPVPVHGTWWVESDSHVTTWAGEEEVEVPRPARERFAFQQSLVGADVEVLLKGEGLAPIRGRVVDLATQDDERDWDRRYERPAYRYWFGSSFRSGSTNDARSLPSGFLVLRTDDDRRSYVDTSMIAVVSTLSEPANEAPLVTRRQPVLVFDVERITSPAAKIRVTYLTKGVAWAPSYRIDLGDRQRLELTQKAVVRNELADLRGTAIELITGFPNVKFGHVVSPLSPETAWAAFFDQLNQRFVPAHNAMSNVIVQQAVVRPSHPGRGLPEAGLTGEGVDLHYHSIGTRDLDEGAAISLETAHAAADYERIVEWVVPDDRQADGRYIDEHQRQRDPEKYDDAPWDAIRFANPLEFPMTTGPAMIVEEDRFRGQTLSTFTNPGDVVTLRITKALSVTTRALEQEEEGGRDTVHVGGRRFRKTAVRGELTATNHRREPVELVVKREFSGKLLAADLEPAIRLREQGAYHVNPRNQLVWSVELAPGEEIKLSYRYEVLVNH